MRPELAAWRYGDQFGRRRRRALLRTGLGLGAIGVAVAGGMWAGFGLAGYLYWLGGAADRVIEGNPDEVVARIPMAGGDVLKVHRRELPGVRLVSFARGRTWRLELAQERRRIEFTGEEAVRVTGRLLPALNRFGGSRRQVGRAVEFLENAGTASSAFREAAWLHAGREALRVQKLPYPVRLALEMAAHEESERRALEGELELLERTWREAEEIAAIADSLLVPAAWQERIGRWRAAGPGA